MFVVKFYIMNGFCVRLFFSFLIVFFLKLPRIKKEQKEF